MKTLEKGQTVIVVTTGNAARRGKVTFKAKVDTLGRKYFTLISIDDDAPYISRFKFAVDNLLQVGQNMADYEVYLSEEDYGRKVDKPVLLDKIQRSLFGADYDTLVKVQEFLKTVL